MGNERVKFLKSSQFIFEFPIWNSIREFYSNLPQRGAKKRKIEEVVASTLETNLIYQAQCLSEFEGVSLVQEFLQHARELQCTDRPHA